MNPAAAAAHEREVRDNALSLVQFKKHRGDTVLSVPEGLTKDKEGTPAKEPLSKRVAIAGDCYVALPCRVSFKADETFQKQLDSKKDDPSYGKMQRFQLYNPFKDTSLLPATKSPLSLEDCFGDMFEHFTDNSKGEEWDPYHRDRIVTTDFTRARVEADGTTVDEKSECLVVEPVEHIGKGKDHRAFEMLELLADLTDLDPDNHDLFLEIMQREVQWREDIPDDELIRLFFQLQKTNKFYETVNNKAMEAMAEHCKENLKWKVSVKRLARLLSQTDHRFFFGYYPDADREMEEKQEYAEDQRVYEYVQPKKVAYEDALDEDADRKLELKKAERKERAKRMNIKFSMSERNLVKPPQNEDVSVRLVLSAQTNARSNIKLKFKVNYIDENVNGQPFEELEVILDETNLRSQACKPDVYEYGYEPAGSQFREPYWKIKDNRGEDLDEIVSLLTNTDIKIVQRTREEGPQRRRDLIQLPYNGAHFSTGIFTQRQPKSDYKTVQRLQQLLKMNGMIHVFVSKDIARELTIVRDAIAYQADFDPLRRFLEDPCSNNLSLKNLKDPTRCPIFKAREERVHRDNFETRMITAIGSHCDHVSMFTNKPYKGIISIIPIQASFNKSLGHFLEYEGSFTLEDTREALKLPKLKPGITGTIVFAKDASLAIRDPWKFTVIEKSAAEKGLSRVTMSIRRQKSTTHPSGWSDRRPETITLKQIKEMGDDFRKHAASLPTIEVTLFTDHLPDEGLKRIMNSLIAGIPNKADSDTALASKMMGMEAIKGRNDHLLPRVKLWSGVNPEVQKTIIDLIFEGENAVKGPQYDILARAATEGVSASLLLISGVAGGGKTYIAELAVAPYALEVIFTEDQEKDRNQARAQLLKAQTAAIKRKLEIQQAEQLQQSGAKPEDLPPIQLNAEQLAELDGMKPYAPRTLRNGIKVIPGQVATLSAMNATVDHSFQRMEARIAAFREAAKLPPALGVRLHSNNTESGISLAFLNPNEGGEEQEDFFPSQLDIANNDVIAQLSANYRERNSGPKFKGVRDKRVTITKKSLAHRALELIGEEALSIEMEHAFTLEERRQFIAQSKEIVDQIAENFVNHQTSKKLQKKFKQVMRRLYIGILSRAHHIGMTISMSMDTLIVTYCQFKAIWTDEASRALRSSIFSQFTLHTHAEIRVQTGDLNQSHGQLFGSEIDNPFKTTAEESPLETFRKRRWDIPKLNETRRYYHNDLIRVVQIANNDEGIKASPSLNLDTEIHPKVEKICNFMQRNFQKQGPVMVAHVANAKSVGAGTSMYSPECVMVGASIAHDMAITIEDIQPVIVTSYKASATLLSDVNEAKARDYQRRHMSKEANLISRIRVATTDEFQGNEGDLVIYVGSCEGYRAFTWDPRRIAVYLSRAKFGFVFVNNVIPISTHKKMDHPLVRFIQWAGTTHTTEINPAIFS